MQKGQVHPSAIRSKNLIAESLLKIMYQVPFSKISVKDIADYADLTRRTFYAHFETKEDVINYYLNQLNKQLFLQIQSINMPGQQEIAIAYFSFWHQHIDFLRLMKHHQLTSMLLINFDLQIKDLKSIFPCKNPAQDESYLYYSSAYFVGILWNVLDHWIAKGAVETPQELVETISRISKRFNANFNEK